MERGPQLSDTSPDAERRLVEGIRKMSPAERLQRVHALTNAARMVAMMDIRRRHPQATGREQALRLASRWLEPDLILRAFGWNVRQEGF
jgi:hypothetical protein